MRKPSNPVLVRNTVIVLAVIISFSDPGAHRTRTFVGVMLGLASRSKVRLVAAFHQRDLATHARGFGMLELPAPESALQRCWSASGLREAGYFRFHSRHTAHRPLLGTGRSVRAR